MAFPGEPQVQIESREVSILVSRVPPGNQWGTCSGSKFPAAEVLPFKVPRTNEVESALAAPARAISGPGGRLKTPRNDPLPGNHWGTLAGRTGQCGRPEGPMKWEMGLLATARDSGRFQSSVVPHFLKDRLSGTLEQPSPAAAIYSGTTSRASRLLVTEARNVVVPTLPSVDSMSHSASSRIR
jgi:hypothetical protein